MPPAPLDQRGRLVAAQLRQRAGEDEGLALERAPFGPALALVELHPQADDSRSRSISSRSRVLGELLDDLLGEDRADAVDVGSIAS